MYGAHLDHDGTGQSAVRFISSVPLVVLLGLVMVLMIAFAIRYRRSRHPQAEPVVGRIWLELLWTLVPLALVMVIFFIGPADFRAERKVPADAMPVKVTGRMWQWAFQYENGKETKRLYVPLDRPIKLNLTSLDVIHSFFIPAFRIKEDAVPAGRPISGSGRRRSGRRMSSAPSIAGRTIPTSMSAVIVMTPEAFALVRRARGGGAARRDRGAGRTGLPRLPQPRRHAGAGPELPGAVRESRTVVERGTARSVIADEAYLAGDPGTAGRVRAGLRRRHARAGQPESTGPRRDRRGAEAREVGRTMKSGDGTAMPGRPLELLRAARA